VRIRTIKPDFFLHEFLFDTEKATGFPLRVAFAGLWCAADREGRFKWEPRKLKAQIMPYDEVHFEAVLDTLAAAGFVVKYTVGDVTCGYLPSFKKHQHVNIRDAESILPSPAGACSNVHEFHAVEASDAVSSQVIDAESDTSEICKQVHARARTSPARVPSLPVPVPVPFHSEGESEGKQPDASSIPQASAKHEKIDRYHPDCRTVLHFLNEAAHAHYREVHVNLNIISQRLFEPDVTLEGVKTMIQRQCRKWLGTEYADYLRPETLFGKTKFEGYYAAKDQPISTNGKPDHRAEKAAKEYQQVITAKLL
jgi:uncharacterized phage protein (TIGR02220 family)